MGSRLRDQTIITKDNTEIVLVQLKQQIVKNLELSSFIIAEKMVELISRKGGRPSAPGQPPAEQTGALAESITYKIDASRLQAQIGSGLPYAKDLELGTRFTAPRPFMVRSVKDSMQALKSIWSGK